MKRSALLVGDCSLIACSAPSIETDDERGISLSDTLADDSQSVPRHSVTSDTPTTSQVGFQ